MGIVSGDYRYESGMGNFGASLGDKPLGSQILSIYHAAMSKYPAYKSTVASQLAQWSKGNANVSDIIIDGVGAQGRVSGLSIEQITDAMKTLASNLRGVVPASYQIIGQAIGNRAANPTIWETVTAVSKSSASDIAKGAQAVGADVLSTYKMAKFLLPVAGVAIIAGLFMRAKGGNMGVGGMVSGLKAMAKKKLQLNPRRAKRKKRLKR